MITIFILNLNDLYQLQIFVYPPSAGPYLIPSARIYPVLCFSKEIQTSAYEVVKGSYVPTALVKPESKPKVFLFGMCIYFGLKGMFNSKMRI